MPSLLFAADNSSLRFNLPAACDLTGAFTMAALLIPWSLPSRSAILNHSDGSSVVAPNLELVGSSVEVDTGGASSQGASSVSTGVWAVIAATKGAGSVSSTVHYVPLGGNPTHNFIVALMPNAPSQAGNFIYVGEWLGVDDLSASVAIVAAWKDLAMSSAGVESLATSLATSGWTEHAEGAPCYLFELQSNTDIPDVMGNGATLDQVVGTVIDASEPPGWTFGVGPPPAPSQTMRPDADLASAGWSTAPLFSKLNDQSDATVITAPLS